MRNVRAIEARDLNVSVGTNHNIDPNDGNIGTKLLDEQIDRAVAATDI
jgi:hypothetical protein